MQEVDQMKITFVGRHMNVPEDMKTLLDKKLAKFDRYFTDEVII